MFGCCVAPVCSSPSMPCPSPSLVLACTWLSSLLPSLIFPLPSPTDPDGQPLCPLLITMNAATDENGSKMVLDRPQSQEGGSSGKGSDSASSRGGVGARVRKAPFKELVLEGTGVARSCMGMNLTMHMETIQISEYTRKTSRYSLLLTIITCLQIMVTIRQSEHTRSHSVGVLLLGLISRAGWCSLFILACLLFTGGSTSVCALRRPASRAGRLSLPLPSDQRHPHWCVLRLFFFFFFFCLNFISPLSPVNNFRLCFFLQTPSSIASPRRRSSNSSFLPSSKCASS